MMRNKWINNIKNYTAAPPAAAWDRIAASLDAAAEAYPEKLRQYEEMPPADVWDKISQRLDTATTAAPVVSIKRFRKVLQYAAAAVVLLFVTGVIYYSSLSGSGTETIAKAGKEQLLETAQAKLLPLKRHKDSATAITPLQSYKTPADIENSVAATSLQKVFKKFKAHHPPAVAHLRKAQLTHNPLNIIPKEKTLVNTALDERYMIATTATGDAVRLPKKVYSVYACNDENRATSDVACKEKLSFLQSKMSASLTTDFAQLLDLLKHLQENTK